MLTGIDHVILAARDPDSGIAELQRDLGLVAGGGGRHDAHGTHNRLIWLGNSYIELMGVFDPELAATSWWGVQMLDVLGGADVPGGADVVGRIECRGGYAGIALACDDLEAEISRLRGLGSPISDPIDGERVRTDGKVVRWRIARLPAADGELGLTFLIEHDPLSAEWRVDDRLARAAEELPHIGRARLARIDLPVLDVARASMHLLRELGIQFRPSLAGGGARDASIGGQTLRLRRSQDSPLPAIALRGSALAERRRATVLGCDWVIDPGEL